MAGKPTDLTVVQASMARENVTSVLSRTHKRITDGDMVGAQGVLVAVKDEYGYTVLDKSDTLTEEEALNMATVAVHAMCSRCIRDDGGLDDAG
jgi:hypothetical protein